MVKEVEIASPSWLASEWHEPDQTSNESVALLCTTVYHPLTNSPPLGAGFGKDFEAYLGDLEVSKVRTLEDVMQFMKDNASLEFPPGEPRNFFYPLFLAKTS